jgi:hypothetical protein
MEDAVRDAAEGLSRAPSPALCMTTAATDDSEPLPSVLLTTALEARTAQHELEDRWAVRLLLSILFVAPSHWIGQPD